MSNLYQQIELALKNHFPSVEVLIGTSEEYVGMAIRQVMRENPDIFWFSHQWHHSQADAKVQFRYAIDNERSEKIKKQIDDVVENDFRVEYVQTLPVLERVMYVYKWIALYCNYNVRSAHNQTIYSVFVLRSSVCTGIAKAAQYLLKKIGIESRLVFGKMNNSADDSRHCWLIVNINGKCYHLDPTFAMPETRKLLVDSGVEPIVGVGSDPLFYNFFCVDTHTIKQSRTIEEEDLRPECLGHIDYKHYQGINVTVSRNGDKGGFGCLLSDTGTTANIYITHNKDKYCRFRSVAKVYKNGFDYELFQKELAIMSECPCAHLLQATDADLDKGILYIEQATPLTELIASHYFKLTIKELCNLLIDIAEGWQELYAHGIIYRDFHLNNIYLSDTQIDGRYIYKLGDFGSCVYKGLTEKGGVGSKWYMAPETWNDGVFDERSAVYGVGMIAYYLLNDLCPPLWKEFKEDSFEQRMNGAKLSLPSKIYEKDFHHRNISFIFRALEYDPRDRFASLSALIIEIENFLSQNLWTNYTIVNGSDFNQENKRSQEEFCSTCDGNPTVEVSNGGIISKPDLDGWAWFEDDDDDNDYYAELPDLDYVGIQDNVSQINDFATTCGGCFGKGKSAKPNVNHEPKIFDNNNQSNSKNPSFLSRLFKKQDNAQKIFSSVFAPSEIMRKQHLLVQVYLHLAEETDKVMSLAVETDKNAKRKGYEPLEVKLKKGDNIEIELNVNGDNLLYNCKKSVVWQGSFVKRSFDYAVPADIDVNELSCSVNIFVNGAIVGEMLFLTDIVDYNARQLNTEIFAKPTKKLFISYSHKDIKSAEKIAKIHEALGINVFFDKHRLKAGYIYSEEISNFIQTADTFVLCWSKNAAESDYVEKERREALTLAYPQCKPRERASLRIHPYNIEPHATPPADMIDYYHFEEL